jgi:hypothetical protein
LEFLQRHLDFFTVNLDGEDLWLFFLLRILIFS